MVARFTYDFVNNFIKTNNYTLLTTEYHNCNQKLELKCNNNHFYKVTFLNFYYGGNRCPYCAGNVKHTYKYIKDFIERFGYKLISENYINSITKLDIICPKGHIFKISFKAFRIGTRCPKCWGDKNRGNTNPSWKGGISKLSSLLRKNLKYKEWQMLSRKKYGEKCIISGNTARHIHHLISFSSFIMNFFKCKTTDCSNETDYNNERVQEFFNYHNNFLGVPLSKEIHKEFHDIYGTKYFTIDNFKEFYKEKTGMEIII